MSSMNLIKIFVYGTLKKKEPNHYVLLDPNNGVAKFVSPAKTVEPFPLVVATRYNIPFLLNKKGTGNRIDGEIYEVDETMFASLDEFEQYPEFYDRQLEKVQTDDGSVVQCWLYLMRKYPESLLSRKMFISYTDCTETPYCESIFVEPPIEQMYADMEINYEKQTADS